MAYGRISLEQALNSDNFYQLPKVIIGTKYYQRLKAEAKLLFMLCRDRMSASLDSTRKGDLRFVDDDGDIFIYYSIEDLSEDLGCGRAKVIKLKKELIKYGLIDEVRQGVMKGNRIYVKNVITDIQLLNMDFDEAQHLFFKNHLLPRFLLVGSSVLDERILMAYRVLHSIEKCPVLKVNHLLILVV